MEIIVKSPENRNNKWISADKFGMDINSIDNTKVLNDAIEYCRLNGINCLKIPNGVYKFDNPENINFHDLHNFSFEGCASEFIFSSPGQFHIMNCDIVTFHDIYIDWDWNKKRLASLIKIVSCNHKNRSLIVEFIELDCVDPKIEFVNMNQFDSIELTAGTEGGKEFWADKLIIENIITTESPNRLKIIFSEGSFSGVKKNEIYLVRHQNRQKPFFLINDSQHIIFEDITVYSVPGKCFYVCGESHHIKFSECKIKLRNGENRRLSSDADGIHVAESCGFILIEKCDFSFMGDDSVNIHDCLGFVSEMRNPKELVLDNKLNCRCGDTFNVRRRNFEIFHKTSRLIEMKCESNYFIYIFEEDLPVEIKEGYMLSNTRFSSSNYIIRNNYFHDHRARGLLLQAGNGLIENNTFYGLQGAAIYIMTETLRNLWYEGNGAKNITIRNNIFKNCNKNNWTSIIDIMAVIPDLDSDYPVFEDIVIIENLFKDFISSAFFINKAKNVSITNNSFLTEKKIRSGTEKCGVIYVNSSSDVIIKNNKWFLSDNMPNGGIIDYNPGGDGSLYRAIAKVQL